MIKITLLNNVFIQETKKYSKREIWARIMETNLATSFVIDLIIIIYTLTFKCINIILLKITTFILVVKVSRNIHFPQKLKFY
jgi:hypothetical protein